MFEYYIFLNHNQNFSVDINALWDKFLNDLQFCKWQEWASTVCQIVSVWYARSNNILVYPTGIVGVLLAFWVYLFIAQPPLYADSLLNLYYFGMSVYGWYNWSLQDAGGNVYPISWCTKLERSQGIIILIAGWVLIWMILHFYTNSNTPILDALVSSSAVTAMWWMSKRKIENWLAWIFSNIVAIPLNFYKGFMLFTFMYFLFLALAWMGFQHWRKNFSASVQ